LPLSRSSPGMRKFTAGEVSRGEVERRKKSSVRLQSRSGATEQAHVVRP
jgi:hypothetical protein